MSRLVLKHDKICWKCLKFEWTAEFNKIAAEWIIVRKRAKVAYLKWSNEDLETKLQEADFDILETDIKRDNKKLAIAQKLAEIEKYKELKKRMTSILSRNDQVTGNGN